MLSVGRRFGVSPAKLSNCKMKYRSFRSFSIADSSVKMYFGFLVLLLATSSGAFKSSYGINELEKLTNKRVTRYAPELCGNPEICVTQECVHAASSIMASMNMKIDPCTDFFEYACGGWIRDQSHRVGDNNLYYAANLDQLPEQIDLTIKELLKKRLTINEEYLYNTKPYRDLFNYFESCMNTDQIEEYGADPVIRMLNELQEFQVGKPFEVNFWNLTKATLELLRINGVPLFDVTISAHVKNSSRWSIDITTPRRYGLVPSLTKSNHMLLKVASLLKKRDRQLLKRVFKNGIRDEAELLEAIAQKNLDVLLDTPLKSWMHSSRSLSDHSNFEDSVVDNNVDNNLDTEGKINDLTLNDTNTIQRELPVISRKEVFRILQEEIDQGRRLDVESFLRILHLLDDIPYTETLHFLEQLDNIIPTERDEILRHMEPSLYDQFSITELEDKFPLIEWRFLLEELFKTQLTEDHRIHIFHPEYLGNLTELIRNTKPRIVHYGMLILYVYDVLKELVAVSLETDREDFCVQVTKNALSGAVTSLYIQYVGKERIQEIRNYILKTLSILKKTLKNSLEKVTWLSQTEQALAASKIFNMKAKVGLYDKYWDIEYVNKSHQGILITERHFFENTVSIYRSFRKELYKLYNEECNSDLLVWEFAVHPYMVNAFHLQTANTIVFPEAFFHPPYYRENVPEYLNFGSTGFAVLHEVFHGLDLTGIYFDHEGLMTKPFSNYTKQHLMDVGNCYHKLLEESFYEEVPIENSIMAMEIDSNATVSENLADIVGLSRAFVAYQDMTLSRPPEPLLPAISLNQNQLFFVAAAQPYCAYIPHMAKVILMELDNHLTNGMRINAMMMNTPEFSEVFHCEARSRMSREKVCQMF